MMEKNILDEIERLKHDYIDLKAEINELNNAINKSQISNSRKRGVYTSAGAACEAMLKFIYQKDTNHQKPVNKLMLDELLIKVNDLLPPQVMINFRTIQAWRNYGTHDKDDMRNADSNSFIMVDMALSNIVNWFFTSYLKIDTPSENKNLINITEIDKVPQKKKINTKKKSADIYLSKEETHIPIENSKQIAPKNKSSVSKPQKKVTEIEELSLIENTFENTKYSEEKIGNQIWMIENLSVDEFRNGDLIPQAKTKDEWFKAGINLEPAWCYFKTAAKGDKSMGVLYNWYAVIDPRGLAPKGWQIPSKDDYEMLISFLGGEKQAANKLHNADGWQRLSRRKNTGTYTTSNPAWWSSSAGNTNGYCFALEFSNIASDVSRYDIFRGKFGQRSFPKGTGCPIVCIKTIKKNNLIKVEGSTESTESGAVLTIGSQVWTSKNLDVTTYRNGDVIPQVQDAKAWAKLRTGAWCYYDNDASNGPKYGKLYNWYAVNDPRGLAPKGFHIPSDAEWTILTDYLGGKEAAGTKMKSSFGWDENGNGSNSSGFAGFPGGFRYYLGTFHYIGSYGYWWSATEDNSSLAWFRYLNCDNGYVDRYNISKQDAFSVRCLGD